MFRDEVARSAYIHKVDKALAALLELAKDCTHPGQTGEEKDAVTRAYRLMLDAHGGGAYLAGVTIYGKADFRSWETSEG